MQWLIRRIRLPPRRIVLWHSVAAVPMAALVGVGALLSWHYHVLTDDTRARIDHSARLLDGTQRLFALVEDAALAVRDYVITGREDALAPFQLAVARLEPAVHQLTPLVQDQADEAAQLAEIDAQTAREMQGLGQVIQVRRAQGFEGARRLVMSESRPAPLAALRQRVGELARAERQRLVEQQAAAQVHERHVIWTGAAVACGSILLRIAIALWMRRMRMRAEPG